MRRNLVKIATLILTVTFFACASPDPNPTASSTQLDGQTQSSKLVYLSDDEVFVTSTVSSLAAIIKPSPTSSPIPLRRNPRTVARTVDRATGQLASDFDLTLFNGDSFRLSDFRGKVVVLNFWASWCPPCRSEMPDFEEMWNEMKDEDVVVVGVAVSDSERDARNLVKDMGITYMVGLDKTGLLIRDYGVTSLPTTFLIDIDGKETRRFGIVNIGALRILVGTQLKFQEND